MNRREKITSLTQLHRSLPPVSEIQSDPHSCSRCKFYTKQGTCQLRQQVIRKHGQKNLQTWLMNSRKRNKCSFYDPAFGSQFFSTAPVSVTSRGHIGNPRSFEEKVARYHHSMMSRDEIEYWLPKILGRLQAEGARELSNRTLERILSTTVAGNQSVKAAKYLRDNEFLTVPLLLENHSEYENPIKRFARGKKLDARLVGRVGGSRFYTPKGIEQSSMMLEERGKHRQLHYAPQGSDAVFDWIKYKRTHPKEAVEMELHQRRKLKTNPEPVTDIIFRVWRGKPHSVIAIFPYDVQEQGRVMMYEHLGQHGSGDYGIVYGKTRLATPTEYAPLKRELESIGYNLRVIQKRMYRRQNAGDIHIDIESHRGSSEENPSRGSRIRKAINAHTKFNFKEPKGVKKFNLPIEEGDSFFFIGGVPQINYLSSKEGKKTEYYHKFHSSCVMYADSNKKCLIIMRKDGKPFQITDWFYK